MNGDLSNYLGVFIGVFAIILFFWDKVSKNDREVEIIKNEMNRITEASRRRYA